MGEMGVHTKVQMKIPFPLGFSQILCARTDLFLAVLTWQYKLEYSSLKIFFNTSIPDLI